MAVLLGMVAGLGSVGTEKPRSQERMGLNAVYYRCGPAQRQLPGPWPVALEATDIKILPLSLSDIVGLEEFRAYFWAHVEQTEGCCLWQGRLVKSGYGSVGVPVQGRYRTFLAHRVAYLLSHGSLDPKLFVCHSCDVRACCAPHHLFEGDNAANIQDMWDKGRGRTHSAVGEKHGMTYLTECQVREIRALYAAGAVQRELAIQFGANKATIANIVQGHTWSHIEGTIVDRESLRGGTRIWKATLNPEKVREIRKRHHAGESPTALAREFGVTPGNIYKISRGFLWKQVQ